MSKWVEVLVDCPGAEGSYTYSLPEHLVVEPGDILSVPFGARQVGAIALAITEHPPTTVAPKQVRSIEGILNRRFFASAFWRLLERVASYYQVALIQVLRAALPPGLLAKSQRRIRLCRDQLPTDINVFLSPAARAIVQQLQKSPTGDYTWQHLQRQGAIRPGLQQLIDRGWAISYLAPPQPPRPKQRQAVTVVTSSHAELSARQQEILTLLQRQGGELWLSDALQLCGTTSETLKRLAKAGHLVIELREILRLETQTGLTADTPKALTPAQTKALETISQQRRGQILLHGVTGSGKTEVYLQAIAPYLSAGRSALVLVPEIGLTPQLTDRFRSRFGDRVRVYHSSLSVGERYDTWRQMLQGIPQVVVGTRSAIFAPLPRLGIVILDEEHDSSFKQDVSPCYHARTVAQWRAELEDCLLVLGSATPSLETWVGCRGNVGEIGCGGDGETRGRERRGGVEEQWSGGAVEQWSSGAEASQFPCTPSLHLPISPSHLPSRYLSLPDRIQARPLPPVKVVDMRQEIQAGNRSIFSRSLQDALRQMKADGNQGLLFIHRRGHSSFVSCRSCGHVMMCPHCDVSLSYHQPRVGGSQSLRCHYCGFGRSHPRHCPECASPYLKHFGSGTQRVEHALKERLPELTCIRFDSDTTRTKGAHRTLLTRFAQGQADLLVGTQMLTKGIDLPQVTLVGIIAADGLLYMGDYWASERAFQTLTQVSGRAGRGDRPGQVILQTYTPEHPVVEAVKTHAYESFAASEWAQRQDQQYPPAGRLVLLRISSLDPDAVKHTAHTLAKTLAAREDGGFELLGPAPAPILRVARRYRWHLLLKFPLTVTVPDLRDLKAHCLPRVSLTIDVDPLNLA